MPTPLMTSGGVSSKTPSAGSLLIPTSKHPAEFRRLLCRFADLNDLVTSAKSQTMAPAVGPEMFGSGESAFSMIGRNVEET